RRSSGSDRYEPVHSAFVGGVRSQAIVCVTPEESWAHGLLIADRLASSSVAPSTERQACRPSNVMHTSHRTTPTSRLVQTTTPMIEPRPSKDTQDAHFMPGSP